MMLLSHYSPTHDLITELSAVESISAVLSAFVYQSGTISVNTSSLASFHKALKEPTSSESNSLLLQQQSTSKYIAQIYHASNAPDHLSQTTISPSVATQLIEMSTLSTPSPPSKYTVIFVLGGPGAGKGTHCSKLAANYPITHLCIGDILREEQEKPGSKWGDLIRKNILEGVIGPPEMTVSLLEAAMKERCEKDGVEVFLLDGEIISDFFFWNWE